MKLFGTDGVRGIANKDLNIELAQKLGKFAAETILGPGRLGKVIIGKDTRISGDLLETALTSGILSRGADVWSAGVIPTPGVAKLIKVENADFGVVISASHNAAHYNGIKFFDGKGHKLSEELEQMIEGKILGLLHGANGQLDLEHQIGHASIRPELKDHYEQHLIEAIGTDFTGLKVAIDCAQGAAYEIAPEVWRRLNAEAVCINCEPDGFNINDNCGSMHPEILANYMAAAGNDFDIGFAHDGDADRVIAVDETGAIVDGDLIIAICAAYLKENGLLKNDLVVTTVMTNIGFDIAMRERGIEVVKTNVGDKYVVEEMQKRNATIGGEQSGHIIFLEHGETGDGILTALMLAKVVKDTGKKLSELAQIMTRYPQVLQNVHVKDRTKLSDSARIWDAIYDAEKELGDNGRVLVRPSGTEPLVRVMVEAQTQEEADRHADDISKVVEQELS